MAAMTSDKNALYQAKFTQTKPANTTDPTTLGRDLFFRPSHYLKIPVYFSPQETGKHYDALIKFENIKTGETLTVKLRANSL